MRLLVTGMLVLLSFPALADEKPRAPGRAAPAAKEPARDDALGRPDYLSDLARQILRRRMERHGRDMLHLMSGVVLLRRDVVRTLAQELAKEPRITRPLPDSRDELNAALPERFFVLQDELRERAKGLDEAAKNGNDAALAESFGRLTQTCVSCHSAFLAPKTTEK
ncbi:MAG: cytochrome c [Myxococcus sp.]|nr:cytochrome c [Myxococcus sp.]